MERILLASSPPQTKMQERPLALTKRARPAQPPPEWNEAPPPPSPSLLSLGCSVQSVSASLSLSAASVSPAIYSHCFLGFDYRLRNFPRVPVGRWICPGSLPESGQAYRSGMDSGPAPCGERATATSWPPPPSSAPAARFTPSASVGGRYGARATTH
jgi:hypothetical protein